MHPMAILGIALVVGLIVYALSLRGSELAVQPAVDAPEGDRGPLPGDDPRTMGFGPEAPPPSGGSFVYVPLAPSTVDWRTRLGGVAGLIVLVVLTAAILAGVIYQAGHIINQTLAKLLR